MALNLLPFRILGTDKLRTGFRAKYNLLLNKIVKDWRIESDVNHPEYGFLYLITHDDTEIPLDMTGVFYTKEVIDSLFTIGPATEEEAGIIRIATIEEALEGGSGNTAITPYSLYMVLLYLNGRMAIAGEDIVIGDYLYLYLPEDAEDPEEEPPFPILHVKKAIATSEFTLAAGFAESEGLEGEEVFIKLSGNVNTYGLGLVPNVRYYLSDSIPGVLTIHPPGDSGSWQQVLGYSISALELMFVPDKGWMNWAPIYDEIPSLYFFTGKETIASVELPPLLFPYNLVEELDEGGFPVPVDEYSYRFLLLPDWVIEHTVVFGTMAITGTPSLVGTHKFFLEVTDKNKRTWFQEFLIVIAAVPDIRMTLLETGLSDPIILGPIPGSYFIPERTDARAVIEGAHDKYSIELGNGGVGSTDSLMSETEELPAVSQYGAYRAFQTSDGAILPVGLYYFEVASFIGIIESNRVRRYFTLFDEITKNQTKFELWNSVKIGDLSIQGVSRFKHQVWWTPRIYVTGLTHDKVTMTLYKGGVQISQRVILVVAAFYNLYTVAQVGQLPDDYIINVKIENSGNVVREIQAEFIILPEPISVESGIILVEMPTNTADYIEIQELPESGVIVNLPELGFNALYRVSNSATTYIGLEFFRKVTGQFSVFDLSRYTRNPAYITVPEGSVGFEALFFGDLSSLDITDIHEAPSSYKFRATERAGGGDGQILTIAQGEVTFRESIDEADLSNMRFLYHNPTTDEVKLIDANMPLTGGVYELPLPPFYWAVAFRKQRNGASFDSVSLSMAQGLTDIHNAGFGGDMVDYLVTSSGGYPGGVTSELASDLEAYIFGTLAGDHRTALNPSNSPVNIDLPGDYIVVASPSLSGVVGEVKSAAFTLVPAGTLPETPEEESAGCCAPKRWNFVNLAVWDIPHKMDSYPEFNFIIANNKWDNGVEYPDTNNAKVTWKRPRTGFAETK